MKRWVARICVFLLLGAIVNVAVAWGCSQWSGRNDPHYYSLRENATSLREWWHANCPVAIMGEPDFTPVDIAPHSSEIVTAVGGCVTSGMNAWSMAVPVANEHGLRLRVRVLAVFTGWPAYALSGQRWTGDDSGYRSESLHPEPIYRWAIGRRIDPTIVKDDTWVWLFNERMLPLFRLWPGFAINTVFYAVILWLLFAGPFVLRRRRRIRRGLCPKCAYDLRGTPEGARACPECGFIKTA